MKKRVTGMGGFFFKSKEPKKLRLFGILRGNPKM